MANIKLKDLYGDEQSYSGVTELSLPNADDDGRTWYVERTSETFVLQDIGYVLENASFSVTSAVGELFDASKGEVNFMLIPVDAVDGVNKHPVVSALAFYPTRGYIYASETLTAAQLQQISVLDPDDTCSGSITAGWNISTENEDGTVTVAHIDDPESVTLEIPLPITFNGDSAEEVFYALFSPASQESMAVTLTENGTQTLTASAGKSGLRSVAVTVDVAGSGGLGAQADWAETNEESAAYIRNKPETVSAADVTAMLASAGVVMPAAVEDNKVLIDDNANIYTF